MIEYFFKDGNIQKRFQFQMMIQKEDIFTNQPKIFLWEEFKQNKQTSKFNYCQLTTISSYCHWPRQL